ncbi:cysteine desulfurase [Ornithobacterium rhinotracheale]|uniref:Probable cysteine desulfurase n=1 Tax=Ornithobacterium rhinotracheale (strain ATCC 51463 / DSM 15997 / CCUG 23171 / CIP 104009 / LMG 9086) TaxID=867902 RepID=I4A2T6_ORNRL|nr:cysteine desulfurase [Ornithobacterium rhinotracheale]AFL98270.1 cysteine desulfurase-like protein, SufS subfamily [Ornithobacterium rhinotracheale DSM 15997]AIQ00047.1 cysteine desulfurase [Ornithobacterium rhinotracheale ORT-UMN 88]KGB66154.1 cysteine desulfurase [Ornithobacterium rhinotracheale H06-030791]MCK0193384.1 cysteine desulfurase [Ornithobacterium rhinotracheale]UOH63450.1 cysteine desulfurase [Ornithobacterium rhinotracheale]
MTIENIKSQFPILSQKVNGKPLVYLDNGATVQKPKMVLDEMYRYYTTLNANVHRGIHTLSQEATIEMENSREKMRAFINAKKASEINFTSGTTDSINLVAYALKNIIKKGDEIIISEIDHHSNIVPWQMLAEWTGATTRYIPLLENGSLDLEEYEKLLNTKTKLVAFNHVSNALGTVNPAKEMIEKAHAVGAWVLVDGAQSAPHLKIDVQDLNADFYAFSGHKMYAPTGTGILYGKEEILEQLSPYRGGGEMIESVCMDKSTYAGLPFKYEAGTPNICGNIVIAKAAEFIENIGHEAITQLEQKLINQTLNGLENIPEIRIFGEGIERSGAVSFLMDLPGVHASDVGMILDKLGIAVRTGHHCCQPLMNKFNISGTIRASFAVYNTEDDVNQLLNGLELAKNMLG